MAEPPLHESDPEPDGAHAIGDLLARECAAIAAVSGALSAAVFEVLAHRLPIVWAASPAPVAWQVAELWRMHIEKPIAAWQAWASLGAWPLAAAGVIARSGRTMENMALAVAADGATTVRAILDALHEQVAANALRLAERSRTPR